MRISLVIPTFNEERMIGACLAHINAQTRPPDEIIVVDNNCTDSTRKIAESFPRVRIVPEHQQGILFARNAGFSAAQGDLILRIDADTHIPPTWVERTEHLAQQSPNISAFTGPCFFYDKRFGRFLGLIHRPLFFGISFLLQGHHTLFGSNMAMRKTAWEDVQASVCSEGDHVVHEDVDLALHLAQHHKLIAYNTSLLVGISGRRMSHSLSSLFSYVKRWITTIQSHALPTRTTPHTTQEK